MSLLSSRASGSSARSYPADEERTEDGRRFNCLGLGVEFIVSTTFHWPDSDTSYKGSRECSLVLCPGGKQEQFSEQPSFSHTKSSLFPVSTAMTSWPPSVKQIVLIFHSFPSLPILVKVRSGQSVLLRPKDLPRDLL